MRIKALTILGAIGPLVAYIFIGISIWLSPWFNWSKNALSDLGHAQRSISAPYYNFGLALTGFLIAIYAFTTLKEHAKITSYFLAAAAFSLQLVAVFDEIYGFLHVFVSMLFFVSAIMFTLVYALEKKSLAATLAFLVGLGSWVFYWCGIYRAGVAVPEAISALAVTSCIILSVYKIYMEKTEKELGNSQIKNKD